ncbi:unnamed protein product [Rotaria magnacalcarata]|uniref:Transposase n=2 Tax=Rotaria magnacalcarata TaxID=392030 RepID=A0A815PHG9_9BILA|nr:unnamed protein product [Rotaria magnacalcarata]CAF3781265.1 unnamed protein product [Rotaria magnacalcarata]CAF3837403.1 unnamed protein product [Rotaria magnacalcarata]CAF3875410.1 unnamed protein product [Rotaria magnacalcarata]
MPLEDRPKSGRSLESDIERLKANRPERRKVRLRHGNARPHASKVTRQKLEKLEWEVLPHPPYSPDLAPSDYHPFRSLRNHLVKKTLR